MLWGFNVFFLVCSVLFGSVIYSLRFWFFEARENPDTAPLVLWFNGGYVKKHAYYKIGKENACFRRCTDFRIQPRKLVYDRIVPGTRKSSYIHTLSSTRNVLRRSY